MDKTMQVILSSVGLIIGVGILMVAIVCFVVTRKCWKNTGDGYLFTDNISKQAANEGRSQRTTNKPFVGKQTHEIRNVQVYRKHQQTTNIFASFLTKSTDPDVHYTDTSIEECEEIDINQKDNRVSDKQPSASNERENIDNSPVPKGYFSPRPAHKGHPKTESLSPRQIDRNCPTPHQDDSGYLVPHPTRTDFPSPSHVGQDHETCSFKGDYHKKDIDYREKHAYDDIAPVAEVINVISFVEKKNNLNPNPRLCLEQRDCVTSHHDYLDLCPDYSPLDPTQKDVNYIYQQLHGISNK